MKLFFQEIKILALTAILLFSFVNCEKSGGGSAKAKEVPTVLTPNSKSGGDSAKAKEVPTVLAPNSKSGGDSAKAKEDSSVKTPEFVPESSLSYKEVYLSYAVLVFALLVIITVLIGFKNHDSLASTKDLTRTITAVVIISSVLFLITAGYSAAQVQPAFGLLGSLAGYILGQQSSNRSSKRKDADS